MRHAIQRGDLGIRERRLSAGEKARRDCWIARGDLACDLKPGVVQRACAEQDFERRIVLLEEAFQMLGEVGFRAMQRFQQADGRGERWIGAQSFACGK